MSGAAARGHRKATRTPDAGLLTAWRRCELIPDPPGLEGVRGNNREKLRMLAKLIHCLCDGRAGTRFFLGSVSLGMLIGKPQQTAFRWLQQLAAQGVIERVWVGRPCRNDETGKPLAGGRLVDRASEYLYLGLPRTS